MPSTHHSELSHADCTVLREEYIHETTGTSSKRSQPSRANFCNLGTIKFVLKAMNSNSVAITPSTARYTHVVHNHFAFIVISFHCMTLLITTGNSRCPCVASSSDRTCSGPPKSAKARSSAASAGNPAVLCWGGGIQQMLAQFLPNVLAQRPGTADAATDLIEVLLKLVHRTSPECGSRHDITRSRIAPFPGAPPAPSW